MILHLLNRNENKILARVKERVKYQYAFRHRCRCIRKGKQRGERMIADAFAHLSEPRVFDYVDFITLDDGEAPLEQLISYLQDKASVDNLKRTFIRRNAPGGGAFR